MEVEVEETSVTLLRLTCFGCKYAKSEQWNQKFCFHCIM